VPAAPWHAEAVAEVLARLETDPRGLADDEAARRLERYGLNRLVPPKPVSASKILGDQLKSVVLLLLLVAVAISVLLGDRLEAAAIAIVLLINTLIGFMTEFRARRAMEALLQFDVSRASVLRSGHLRAIAAEHLVPGDIIELNAGQHVPADARLIHSTDLRTVEARGIVPLVRAARRIAWRTPHRALPVRRRSYRRGRAAVGSGRHALRRTSDAHLGQRALKGMSLTRAEGSIAQHICTTL
jgi:hypothetical protein